MKFLCGHSSSNHSPICWESWIETFTKEAGRSCPQRTYSVSVTMCTSAQKFLPAAQSVGQDEEQALSGVLQIMSNWHSVKELISRGQT